jgi:hypothetical protein
MRLSSLLALLCLALVLSGCPKKKSAEGDTSGEPVEGVSTPANEKSAETASSEEMQEKKGGNGDATAPTSDGK